MAFNGSDAFPISRAGTNYKCLGSDVLAYIQANVGTSDYRVANITARNALGNLSYGDSVMVDDATADGTVAAGWALYQYLTGGVWRKVAEQESLDIVMTGSTNLTYTAGATQGIVVSDTGADAILPSVDAVNAGLALPAHKTKLDLLTVTAALNLDTVGSKVAFLTVTSATDLDAIRGASHAAVSTAGSGATNPIVATGQVLSFNIAGLTAAP